MTGCVLHTDVQSDLTGRSKRISRSMVGDGNTCHFKV